MRIKDQANATKEVCINCGEFFLSEEHTDRCYPCYRSKVESLTESLRDGWTNAEPGYEGYYVDDLLQELEGL